MKKLLLLLFTFTTALLQAQDISGTVTDRNSGNALPFASVLLKDAQKEIISVTADDKGTFTFNTPNEFTSGTLIISYVGYTTLIIDITKKDFPLTIKATLLPDATELNEVTLTSKKDAVTLKGDKMIYSIEKTGLGNGNNGLETLRQLPGMSLDKDENLIFRGSNVQVMINGKKSLLQGDALREYIRSLKGSDIATVEIIAQPSARYDAAGTAGIINIVLKKNRAAGLSGNVYTYTGYGEYFKAQQGTRLFYNDSLWTINGNASYYDGKSVNHRRVKQTIVLDEGTRNIDQRNEWLPVTTSKNANLAAERKLGKNELISTELQYDYSGADENTYGITNEYMNGQPVTTVDLKQHIKSPSERITGNLFYNYTSDSLTTKLDTQANYAHYKTTNSGYLRNDYPADVFMQLNGSNKTTYDVATVQADLVQKIGKHVTLEAGAKYSFVDMTYYNRYDTNNAGLLIIPDSLLVNDFSYKEHLTAAYTQVSLDLEKWNFMAGLRMEHQNYTAASLINNQTNRKSYTNFFPSFSANYKEGNSQYQLSYSRRIGRPNYLALNPYYQYIDAYTLEKGNPALRPQLYHSLQLSYVYKSALNLSLYGYRYKNGFTNVIDYQESDNYNITYQANAAKGNRLGFSASMPYEVNKWWSMQLSLDGNYNSESAYIPGFTYSGSGWGYSANMYESFTLKNDWNINISGFYNGRATAANGYSRATYDMSVSVKKSLLEKKLQLSTGCSNLLKRSFYNTVTQVNNVTTDWTNRWETRRFFFQAVYYFGNGKSKNIKSASLGEETNRI